MDSLENETRGTEHTDGTAAHARMHTGGMGSLRGRGHGDRSMEISRWKRIGNTKKQYGTEVARKTWGRKAGALSWEPDHHERRGRETGI